MLYGATHCAVEYTARERIRHSVASIIPLLADCAGQHLMLYGAPPLCGRIYWTSRERIRHSVASILPVLADCSGSI